LNPAVSVVRIVWSSGRG